MEDQQKIAILKNLIRIRSVNGNEAAVAEYLASLFRKYPAAKIEKINYSPGRDNLVVTIGGTAGKMLGFSGHLDVVAAGRLTDWQHDPFDPWITDGKLFGRGAADMKGGLAALVVAMLELLENQVELPGQIRLLASVGEETGEYGAAQLTDKGYADQLDGLVIAEPSVNMEDIIYTTRGVIDYRITSIGKTAHSARPQFGINTIDNLLICLSEIRKAFAKFDQTDPILGPITHNVTQIKGGEQVNSIPSYAEMTGNIRTIPQYPNRVFFAEFERILKQLNAQEKFKLAISYMYPQEAVPGRADSELIKTAQTVYQTIWQHPAKITGGLGSNDSAEFIRAKKKFDYLKIGPGSYTSHQSNEYIKLDVYLKAIKFYQRLAMEFLKQ